MHCVSGAFFANQTATMGTQLPYQRQGVLSLIEWKNTLCLLVLSTDHYTGSIEQA